MKTLLFASGILLATGAMSTRAEAQNYIPGAPTTVAGVAAGPIAASPLTNNAWQP
jgi:hypothetical protein